MKDKVFSFLAAIGIPLCSLQNPHNICNGICGNCRFACIPALVLACCLIVKALYKKLKKYRYVYYE